MSRQIYISDSIHHSTNVKDLENLDQEISIIIPAYNEERRIARTIRELELNIPEISEIIVVSDGIDNTDEVALKSGKKVKVLRYDARLGHGGAVFEGLKHAKSPIQCFIDADGSAPWYEVKRLCKMVNEHKSPVVIGSRWVEGALIHEKEPLRNILGGRVFQHMASLFLGINERDVFCGLKAFSREVAHELIGKITVRDRMFNVAIIYHLKILGIKPMETGIEWTYMDGTKLPVDIKAVIMMFMTLIGLRFANNERHRVLRGIAVRTRKKIHFF